MSDYFIQLQEYYNQLKQKNPEAYPESVINIYSPEYDCYVKSFPTLVNSMTTHYNINIFNVIEFFIYICNNNKFETKDDIMKFFKFITKNYDNNNKKYMEKYLLRDMINKIYKIYKINTITLYDLFIHAFFEKIPNDILNNDIILKTINCITSAAHAHDYSINDVLKFIIFINKTGFEFDTKIIKKLKDLNFDMSTIKSKDININIKKYSSYSFIENIFKLDLEQSKKIFFDSLIENNISSDKIELIFEEINKILNEQFECKFITNIINIKLYYEIDITNTDIYLLSQYDLSEKVDLQLIKEIQAEFDKKNYILDFNNLKVLLYFRKSSTVKEPEDIYGRIKDVRYNYREILNNICSMNFKLKKYNNVEIKSLMQLFEKYASDYFYNKNRKIG